MGLDSLRDVFEEQINDLRSAEEQLVEALPKLAAAATSPELKQAFEEHLAETRQHVERLDDVFSITGLERSGETCEGMRGLIKEGSETAAEPGDGMAKDAALIAAAQRVEHYEIAGYGTVRTFAQRLGKTQAAQLLQQTLEEEAATDKKLTSLAETMINPRAQK